MLKSILNVKGAQGLTKNEQKAINGGGGGFSDFGMDEAQCNATCDDCRPIIVGGEINGYYCHGEPGGYGGLQQR